MNNYHIALFAYMALIAGAIAHKVKREGCSALLNAGAFIVYVAIPAALGYFAGASQ